MSFTNRYIISWPPLLAKFHRIYTTGYNYINDHLKGMNSSKNVCNVIPKSRLCFVSFFFFERRLYVKHGRNPYQNTVDMKEQLITLSIPSIACPYIMKTNQLPSPLGRIYLFIYKYRERHARIISPLLGYIRMSLRPETLPYEKR